jgi:hypothetical protein
MKVLLLNQCFYPDVMATAQHLTDLAVALVREGHEVTVVASDRGYDNPSKRASHVVKCGMALRSFGFHRWPWASKRDGAGP